MFKIIFGFAIVFFVFSMSLLFITIKQYYFDLPKQSTEQKATLEKDHSFHDVTKYIPVIHSELKKYKLEKYTVALVALMQQESGGKGGDPMQASESVGLAPNSIANPKESIKQGVKHFHRVFTYGEKNMWTFQPLFKDIIWASAIFALFQKMVVSIAKN